MSPMLPYDPTLVAAVRNSPQTVQDVLQTLRLIQSTCADGDGLKWFNWLYLEVTQAVADRVAAGGFTDPAWLSTLDVNFASFYLNAMGAALQGEPCSACWQALFDVRTDTRISRIQFAMAGINSHINHDLPEAIVTTYPASGPGPLHGTSHYADFTDLNTTLDSLIQQAKTTLGVRLLGDALPPISQLENTIGAWSVSTARELAWNNSEILWSLQATPPLAASFVNSLDGLSTVASKTLLVPVP